MTPNSADVKSRAQKVAYWFDSHPRTGWWIALWAILVTSNALIEWFDRLLGLVG